MCTLNDILCSRQHTVRGVPCVFVNTRQKRRQQTPTQSAVSWETFLVSPPALWLLLSVLESALSPHKARIVGTGQSLEGSWASSHTEEGEPVRGSGEEFLLGNVYLFKAPRAESSPRQPHQVPRFRSGQFSSHLKL